MILVPITCMYPPQSILIQYTRQDVILESVTPSQVQLQARQPPRKLFSIECWIRSSSLGVQSFLLGSLQAASGSREYKLWLCQQLVPTLGMIGNPIDVLVCRVYFFV
jgi:hypothetical protein